MGSASKSIMACASSKNALKLLFVVLCVATFAYQMSFIFGQWRNEETTISMENIVSKTLRVPTFTVCTLKAFKRDRTNPSEKEYLAATYDASEIFEMDKVTKYFNVTTVRSATYGRCYTLKSDSEVQALALTGGSGTITFSSYMDVEIFGT